MGITGTKIGKKAVRLANDIVNLAVLIIVLLLVLFSCYALWDSDQVYLAADATQFEVYKPTIQDEGLSFGELQKRNPDVFAWLTVYGTHIDYPVTQGENNMKYVNTNAFGEYSFSGSIFLDSNNAKDFSDFNSILFGHHMEKQAMFGELGLFSDSSYFNERPYGNLYYNGKDYGLEFFAFLHVDAYDSSVFTPGIQGEVQQQIYVDNLLEKAKLTRDMKVTSNDRIVLLSTCSSTSTNGRDILVGRITDTLYEDAFIGNGTDDMSANTAADKGTGFWAKLPVWAWCLIALILLLILGFVFINRKKNRNSSQNNEEESGQKE